MNLYSLQAIDGLIKQYESKGGMLIAVKEGSLGYGISILLGLDLKMAVITEVYLNEWSSGHKVRFYNKPPKKYLKSIVRFRRAKIT